MTWMGGRWGWREGDEGPRGRGGYVYIELIHLIVEWKLKQLESNSNKIGEKLPLPQLNWMRGRVIDAPGHCFKN